jgi:hypothetical protein
MSDSTSHKIPKLKGSSIYDIWALRVAAILSEKDLEFGMKNKDLGDDLELGKQNNKACAIIKLSLKDGPLYNVINRITTTLVLLYSTYNVDHKRAAHISESRTLLTLLTSSILAYNSSTQRYLITIK